MYYMANLFYRMLFSIVCFLCFACEISAVVPNAKTVVTAQKIVKTEYGDVSVGILIPDRGMADPHVWIEDGTLYMMCGHDKSWEPVNTWIMDRWELWSTKNLTEWTYEYTIEPTDTYIGNNPNCWAGDLAERSGKYYWFFSNRNISTGVMEADRITGPYKDVLGKPLLPSGIIKGHPYDPEIFIENGVYTICFGAGTYYMATLADDMHSLVDTPKAIKVLKDGKHVSMGDKSTLFKRDGWYYLLSGGRYAMSKELYGPYDYKGSFGGGGHNSVFQWKGKWYMVHETGDTNIFYRGIGLQPLYFNEDGTIYLAKKRAVHPGNGRDYTFTASQMGWRALDGTSLRWSDKGFIEGRINGKNAVIGSAVFLWCDVEKLDCISLELTNNTESNTMRIGVATHDDVPLFWDKYSPDVKSDEFKYVTVPIKKGFQKITLPIDEFKGLKNRLMQVRIEPASDALDGEWKLDNIIIR